MKIIVFIVTSYKLFYSVDSTAASYYRGPRFKSWPRDSFSCQDFCNYSPTPQANSKAVQPLPNLHKGCIPQNFTQVKFYISQNFHSIQFFLSHVQEKLQKCALKCTVTRLRQRRLHIFAILVTSTTYCLWDAKYVSTTFLSLHQLAKNYVQSHLLKSGSYCISDDVVTASFAPLFLPCLLPSFLWICLLYVASIKAVWSGILKVLL